MVHWSHLGLIRRSIKKIKRRCFGTAERLLQAFAALLHFLLISNLIAAASDNKILSSLIAWQKKKEKESWQFFDTHEWPWKDFITTLRTLRRRANYVCVYRDVLHASDVHRASDILL